MPRLWVVGVLLAMGCASAPIRKPDVAALGVADAQVLRGCYDCLLDARATYERVAVGRARPLVIARLFEVDLLLAVREKELALDASPSLQAARLVAKELPQVLGADRYLTIVDDIPGHEIGWTRRETATFTRDHASALDRAPADIAWLATGELRTPVRQYLALALDCAYPRGRTEPAPRPGLPEPGSDAPPLVLFRTAICRDRLNESVLSRVRADESRFAEAALYLARLDMATAAQKGPGRGAERLAEAFVRFPTSPVVTYLFGTFNQLIGTCGDAVDFYDKTIALKPEHERALLGRTICLSYLNRNDEAIRTATRLIELQTPDLSDAYYWRAWNHHARRELEVARADIGLAKQRGVSSDIYTLAGIIEHDQDDLGPAESDLVSARKMGYGSRNCTAMWYLGLVHLKRERWLPAGQQFEDAMNCFGGRAIEAETALKALQTQTDLDATFRARRIAGIEAELKENTTQRYAGALNAASCYASGGDRAAAGRLLDIAAKDPSLAEGVGKLKEWVSKQ